MPSDSRAPWRDGVRIKSARETRAPDVFITHSGSVKLRRTVKTRKYSSLAFSHSKALREGSIREGSIGEVGVREGSVREGTGWDNWVGKTDLILKESLCTLSFLASDYDRNTVRKLLLENGTVQKNSLRLKFVFSTFGRERRE